MAGRTGEAEEFHRRALSIRGTQLGLEEFHRRPRSDWRENWGVLADLAPTQYSLGVCVFIAGLNKEGEKLYRRTLACWKDSQCGHAFELARTLYALGVVTFSAGRAQEDRRIVVRAKNIWEKRSGSATFHPNEIDLAEPLRFCIDDARQTKDAEELVQRALDIQEQLREENPSVPSTCACYRRAWCCFPNASFTVQ